MKAAFIVVDFNCNLSEMGDPQINQSETGILLVFFFLEVRVMPLSLQMAYKLCSLKMAHKLAFSL